MRPIRSAQANTLGVSLPPNLLILQEAQMESLIQQNHAEPQIPQLSRSHLYSEENLYKRKNSMQK